MKLIVVLLALGLSTAMMLDQSIGKPRKKPNAFTPGSVSVTDTSFHSEPSLPSLPSVGNTVTDPTFGTPIMRLTDSNDGTDCMTEYSHWPSVNVNSSRIKVLCVVSGVNRTRIFDFNPVTFTRGSSHLMTMVVQSTDPTWSHLNSVVLFGYSGAGVLYAYNAKTQTTEAIKDFAGHFPVGGALAQMTVSLNDDVFGFHTVDSGFAAVGYLVWRRSTDTFLLEQTEANIDETKIDKSGRYFSVIYNTGDNKIWDLQGGPSSTSLTWGVNGFFHNDAGIGTLLTYNGSTAGFGFRSLASPTSITSILVPPDTNGRTAHFSMLANNESWGLVNHYNNDGSSASLAFDNEIFQVRTNGSGSVRRIVHHRSVFNDYFDSPFGNISMDGKFVVFTSNWGSASGRRDAFVAYIVPASP